MLRLVANATVAEGVPLGVTPPGKLAAELIPWWITERWLLFRLRCVSEVDRLGRLRKDAGRSGLVSELCLRLPVTVTLTRLRSGQLLFRSCAELDEPVGESSSSAALGERGTKHDSFSTCAGTTASRVSSSQNRLEPKISSG